jgi:hypothetical protein
MLMYFFSPAKMADVMAALQLVGAEAIRVNEVESAITVTFHASLDDDDKKVLAFFGSLER